LKGESKTTSSAYHPLVLDGLRTVEIVHDDLKVTQEQV
jgi:hypothetical protein